MQMRDIYKKGQRQHPVSGRYGFNKTMTEHPSGEDKIAWADNRHRPELAKQRRKRRSLQEDAPDYYHKVTHRIDQGDGCVS